MKLSKRIDNLVVSYSSELNEASAIKSRLRFKNSQTVGKGEEFTREESQEMMKILQELGFKTIKKEYMEEGTGGAIRYEEWQIGRGDLIWVTKEVHYDTVKQTGPGYNDFEDIPAKDVKPKKFVRGSHSGKDAIYYHISTNRTGKYVNKLSTDDNDVWEGDFLETFKDAVESWVKEHFKKEPQ